MRMRNDRYKKCNSGRLIAVKSKVFTNFATCQLFLGFSDQNVRDDNLSVHVQGSNAPCECSKIQIAVLDGPNVPFPFACDC
jgi:hypothetical protein